MSPAKKNKTSSLAVLAVCCVLLSRPINFVALTGRRAILSGALLPTLLSAGSAQAADKGKPAAAAKTAAAPAKEDRISRTDGTLKYSFVLPNKDFEADKSATNNIAHFVRKDGSFVTIRAAKKGDVRKRLIDRAGPGNGFKLENFKEGADQDVLEWTKLPTIQRGSDGGGPVPGGFLFIGQGDADWTSYHQWYRSIHTDHGDALITAAVNQDSFKKDEKLFKGIIDSFRVVDSLAKST